MKTPVHNVKDFVIHADGTINPHWSHNSARGWLGSGVKDKNGVEIFEGDIVNCGCEGDMTVVFSNGVFCIENQIETYELPDCHTSTLEVVGHIAEEKNYDIS